VESQGLIRSCRSCDAAGTLEARDNMERDIELTVRYAHAHL